MNMVLCAAFRRKSFPMRHFLRWIELASALCATVFCAGLLYAVNADAQKPAYEDQLSQSASIEGQLVASICQVRDDVVAVASRR